MTVAAALALTGCGDAAPEPVASAESYQVPGVPVTLTAPAGWGRITQDGAFALRSPDAVGDPSFRANVVVTGRPSDDALDAAGAETAQHVAAVRGWVPDAEGQGPTTLGEIPAYRVSGTYDAQGVDVAQEVYLVGSPARRSTSTSSRPAPPTSRIPAGP